MNILPCSSIPITSLLNAVVVNTNDYPFYIGGIGFDLRTSEVMVDLFDVKTLEYHSSTSIAAIRDWSIQFNSHSSVRHD